MRLFTAIHLTPEILLRLERLLSTLRAEALIKWSPLDNLHITTKFIGEWPEARLDELHEALGALAPREPFQVELKDLGWFPNERSP
ncbi:MAG TPA: RNA 2',3'-cyclic phosphodiesterase, partial [Bryobacteraceae bacterium]|nr:RNA 2',3'-cyclic phosphodiesterase [Bryobacteraceae bacterium]